MDLFTLILGTALGLGFAADQDPQDGFYGCEVKLVDGGNYYNFVDPTCVPSSVGVNDLVVVAPVVEDEEETDTENLETH